MQNVRIRRLGVVGAVAAVAVLLFIGGVATGRSSTQESAGAAAPTTTLPPAGSQAAPRKEPHITIYGDSLVTQAEPYLQAVSRALGLEVEARALGGTAPCDFLQPLQDDLDAHKVDLVVWAFSGNSIG